MPGNELPETDTSILYRRSPNALYCYLCVYFMYHNYPLLYCIYAYCLRAIQAT